MKKIILASALVVAMMLVSCKPKDAKPQSFNFNPPASAQASPAEVERLDSLLQSVVEQNKAACAMGFVAQHGNVLYNKGFGYKDLENGVPVNLDDYFVLFSMTKAITTVAFMTLYEKGLVDIYAPVSSVFPDIPDQVLVKVNEDGSYETRPVTTPMNFVHLMSHSSGLSAGEVGRLRMAEMRKLAQEAGTNGQRQRADYLSEDMQALAKYPLGFDPGSEYSYHISTNMLAYMVELISGETLRDYVKKTVLDPLGMNDTDWYFPADRLERFVNVYSSENGEITPTDNTYSKAACGPKQTYCEGAIGLSGTMGDYAKFAQMLLNGGEFNGHRILKKETVELMTGKSVLPEVNSGGDGFQFGMGFQVMHNGKNKRTPDQSDSCFNWGGALGTEFMIDPENDAIFLYFINMSRRPDTYTDFLTQAYKLIKK